MANIRPLTKQLQTKAKEELNEDENRIPEDLQHLKNWLAKQPHLKVRLDDQWLVTFLRGCKYSLEKTKAKLDLYYSIRNPMPEIYKRRYPYSSAISGLLKLSTGAILPQSVLSTKPTLFLVRWDCCKSDNCTLVEMTKLWFMVIEILINEDDNMAVSGVELIVDFSQFTLEYALQFTPAFVKKTLLAIENAYPMRIKGIYAINAPPIFETVYSLVKTFMSEKLKNRMHVFSSDNMHKFYNYVPQHSMPEEYGGDNPPVHKLAGELNKKVEGYGKWFLDDEQYCSNESLRPANYKSPQDILGLEGSFRKLNVD